MYKNAAALFVALALGQRAPVPGAEAPAKPEATVIRSTRSGAWSDPATWEGGKVPGVAARVQVRAGHTVVFDVQITEPVRSVHVAGTLTFAPDRDTRLDVGLIKVQPGDDAGEDGFNCDAHVPRPLPGNSRPALEVGTPDRPIPAGRTARIRLVYFDGMDRESCPAVVCCGGRMDFHGAPLNRTWVKLGAPARAGDTTVTLAEPVTGWRDGDRVILTATTRQIKVQKTYRPSVRDNTQTEERTVRSVRGATLTLDRPLAFDHVCDGAYRGEVANLSRNVVVESADPARARGHTMYHRHSAGSIAYAEFCHLGKEGVLGRYALHYHLAGDTMRGSSVVGASVWDSGNRWLTVHGTHYLVVRDCVGYHSRGHGFFLEDGTEVYNVFDRNLAVQACTTQPLRGQVFPFDDNDGAGFWWANSRNTFTRNVACECDEYGFFFQAAKTPGFDPSLPVPQPDGTTKLTDIRTLPFVRFEDNEAHCQRRHAFNLGGGSSDPRAGDIFNRPNVAGVGPDARHPFVVRNLKVWDVHWSFHPVSPSVLVDGLDVHNADYGIWRPVYERHAYKHVQMDKVAHGKESVARGPSPREADFPNPLDPVDDLPPATVITHWRRAAGGTLLVRGTTSDNGTVARVVVNGTEARAMAPNFAEWEAVVPEKPGDEGELSARAEDAAGNVEQRPHVVRLAPRAEPVGPPADAPARGTVDAPAPATSLEGTWTGDSICQVPGSSCRDEKAVYRLSRPKKDGKVSVDGGKLVNGKVVSMGVLEFDYDPRDQSLTYEYRHGVWRFTVKGDTMTGTLTRPDKVVYRRVLSAQRRQLKAWPGAYAPPPVEIRLVLCRHRRRPENSGRVWAAMHVERRADPRRAEAAAAGPDGGHCPPSGPAARRV